MPRGSTSFDDVTRCADVLLTTTTGCVDQHGVDDMRCCACFGKRGNVNNYCCNIGPAAC
ncbi:hypothetical protein V1264_020676 [Littorina saxatilis]|uniref:Uncharacterized protein n=1 Tax=Littorina saxatilis TaxID=31220 RepID=A0AAN9BAL4_9CAEN